MFPRKLQSKLTTLLLLAPSVLVAAVCVYAIAAYRAGQCAALGEEAALTLQLLAGHRPIPPGADGDRRSRIETWVTRVGHLRERLPRVRYVALVDAAGRDLSQGRLDAPGKLVALARPSTEPRVVRFSGGKPALAIARRPLPDIDDAYVWIGLEAGPIWATLARVQLQAGAILIASLLLNVWIVRHTLRLLIRPLDSLSRQSEALAEGTAVRPVEIEGPEEIARVSHAFNAMLARHEADAIQIRRTFDELERKHREVEFQHQRFLAMVEALHEGIVFLDADGSVEYANRMACDLLQVGREDSASGLRPLTRIGRSDSPPAILERLLGAEKWDEVRRNREFELTKTVVRGPEGRPGGTMILLRDRTQQRRIERQLAEQDKIATVGLLAAGVAHEINNPLDGLQNCLRRIVNDPTNTAQIERYAGLMTASLSHIETVVRQLLNLSHKRDRSLRPVSINDVLREAVALAVAGRRGPEIEIEWQLAEDLPPVLADSQNMTQVFLNLTMNAFHAMPDGGRLTLRTSRVRGSSGTKDDGVIIEVTDTGRGMTADVRARVFEPFFTTDEGGDGTGLGLTVSQNLIIEHGGRIELESEPGRGTTFRVRLPRHFASERLAAWGQRTGV